MRLTLNGINRRGKDQCVKFWMMKGKKVLIWSAQWRKYWRENGQGYTADPFCAGVYDFEDAYARTAHCGPEKQIVYYEVRS